jgi:hypothetical protein
LESIGKRRNILNIRNRNLAAKSSPLRAFSRIAHHRPHRLTRRQQIPRQLTTNIARNSSNRKHRQSPYGSKIRSVKIRSGDKMAKSVMQFIHR